MPTPTTSPRTSSCRWCASCPAFAVRPPCLPGCTASRSTPPCPIVASERAACKKHFAPDFGWELLENSGCGTAVQRCSAEPDKLALKHEMYRLVEGAISRLPELYRGVYMLADVEELSNTEIAGLLGLS